MISIFRIIGVISGSLVLSLSLWSAMKKDGRASRSSRVKAGVWRNDEAER